MEGTAEIDSPLEGDGFEPLVPPWREVAVSTPLTAPFARSHTRNDKPPSASGPGVRIRFAPAESLSQWCVPVRAGEKAEPSRRFAGGLGREKGRASDGRTVLGAFSLTGIVAVP